MLHKVLQLFFDGLHDHLHLSATMADIQLRWQMGLIPGVVLPSCSASGLQLLLDGMYHFCLGLGLVISPTKTEVVLDGSGIASIWQVGNQVLLQSASFKYLGMVFC